MKVRFWSLKMAQKDPARSLMGFLSRVNVAEIDLCACEPNSRKERNSSHLFQEDSSHVQGANDIAFGFQGYTRIQLQCHWRLPRGESSHWCNRFLLRNFLNGVTTVWIWWGTNIYVDVEKPVLNKKSHIAEFKSTFGEGVFGGWKWDLNYKIDKE